MQDHAPASSPQGAIGELDFRAGGRIGSAHTASYRQIASEIRTEYADFVGCLCGEHRFALDWWLEATATRNPVFSNLFHQLVCLLLLQRLFEQGEIPDTVMVDSKPMKSAVTRLSLGYTDSLHVILPPLGMRTITTLRNRLSPYRSMIRLLAEWALIRYGGGYSRSTLSTDRALILIDTFAIPGFIDSDRYYPGLLEHAGAQRDSIRFVPQFFNLTLTGLFRAGMTLRNQRQTYLLKEDFLGLGDMVWCFGHLTRIKQVRPTVPLFRNIDIGGLVDADINRRSAFRCAVRGLMNYRFARALKRRDVRISSAIDWFENHPMDRGWNAGFNTYFPDVRRVGYTGFFPAGQSFRPTVHEYNSGLLPPQHLIMGAGFGAELSEFFPHCKIATAPAFRYSDLPALNPNRSTRNRLLIAMPYYREMGDQVISMLGPLLQNNPSWRMVIKPHPAQPLELSGHLASLLKGNAEITLEPLGHWLEQCDVMLTGAQASTILEAAAYAVPTVVLVSDAAMDEVSIPVAIPTQLFQISSNCADVEDAVKRFLEVGPDTAREWRRLAEQFRKQCFTPVTQQSVGRMLSA